MIPQETVNRILDAAQIVDVVGDFVTLKKRGANHIACCPFHNEKTPSFSVSASKGIYKCFGCGKSGTAVGFVMEHENMSYVEALRYLAKKYNIEVVEKEETAEEIAQRQKHESLMLVSEYAGKFFQESMNTPEGQNIAYQYFRSRGLTDETIRKYGTGAHLSSDETRFLKEIGFSDSGIRNNLELFLQCKKSMDFVFELALIKGKARTKSNPCGWCIKTLRGKLQDLG